MTEAASRPEPGALSRRGFLATASGAAGSMLIACHVPFGRQALAQASTPMVIDPNVFVRIAADNTVTLISKHFEMGQGVTTGMATLIADELEADWSRVKVEVAPVDTRLYANNFFHIQATGGSTSIPNSWEQMRKIGAAGRMMLASAAAAKWNVPATSVTALNGVVRHAASNRQATYGELAADAMRLPVPKPEDVKLKDPKDWTLIGRKVSRLDSVAKTTGEAKFALDVRRPGALTAVVRRAPQFGATVKSFDATEARKVPGVVDVVQVPSGIAVLAQDTWSAMRGRAALKVNWDASKAETRSTIDILKEYQALAGKPGLNALRRGDAEGALKKSARVIEAEFAFPYLAHAPMEPLNCLMELKPEGAEIWSGCQLHTVDQLVAARVLGLKPEQVRINTQFGGGSFGRRGNPVADWIAELAAVTKAINGRAPVHVVWTREDDIHGGYYRPMALHRVRVGITRDGRISGWQHAVVCKSIFSGTPFEPALVKNGVDHASVEGVTDTPYALPDMSVDLHNPSTPVPVLWWRSVGHSHTAHVMETVIDELAQSTRKDALAYRLGLLGGAPRQTAVLKLAAEKAGWGGQLPKGRGRGIACHHGFNAHIAMVASVTVARGRIKVDRIVAAVDCGIAVNPDVVVAQVEGSIGFALSSVLRNEITLKAGMVEQSNFHDYEPTRMSEMPKVEVHIVQSTAPPSGIGEPAVAMIAPAIGNAIYAATGKRLRNLPFDTKALA